MCEAIVASRGGLRSLFAVPVAVAQSRGHVAGDGFSRLEAINVRWAVEQRRLEYLSVRVLARRAMRELELREFAINSGASREPVWVNGTVGSMTHCDGYCAAVVGRQREVASLGVDVEPIGPLATDVEALIVNSWDLDINRHMLSAGYSASELVTLTFSAKEAVYKAWYPLARRWLGFDDVFVEFDPQAGTFLAYIVPGASGLSTEHEVLLTKMRGRWLVGQGLVMTGVAVSAG